ncbi:MAG: alpha glucosidase [Gammaproteobacteria bacterium]
MSGDLDWWRGAVIYQIYPRSFFDSNGDGDGDLPGVTSKMDYIASLGVDAIWLSPFFTSPMKDMGYDISDYRNVDPRFGTLTDVDVMIAAAHQRGIKVIIDQVLNHTSDQHPWFEESRRSRHNPKSDWYVWADPKMDGTVPNNWLSVFGGSSWQWDSRRRQYYLHNFLSSQPDLNFHNPEVVEQLLSDMTFWLERGVDGFRLDAIDFCYYDLHLRDNPSKLADEVVMVEELGVALGAGRENPYTYQHHLYDKTCPENLLFLAKVRKLMDKYPGVTTIGELGGDGALETMGQYTSGNDKLHMAYTFELVTPRNDVAYLRSTIEKTEIEIKDGWPCWTIGNHDCMRVATRWSSPAVDDQLRQERLRVYAVLLLTLRGSVCIYQGEELGLEEADLAYEDLVDPFGLAFWPEFKGRDGCRTPMPWRAEEELTAGFSTGGKSWLPLWQAHRADAVNVQEDNPESLLNAYRTFLRWRRGQKILLKGAITVHDACKNVLLFERSYEGKRLLVALNFSNQAETLAIPGTIESSVSELFLMRAEWGDHQVCLPPYGIGMAWLKR